MKNFTLILAVVAFSFSGMAQKNAYINTKGEVVFEVPYKYAYDFSSGMARVQDVATINGKRDWFYGFIDEKGKLAIPLQYYAVRDFECDFTFVQEQKGSKWMLIDKTGKKALDQTFDKVGSFWEGMCEACNALSTGGFTCGWVDSTGKLAIPIKYLGGTFKEGLASTCEIAGNDEKYGFLDKTGKAVIPFKYLQAGSSNFYEGLARVKVGGKTGLIDKNDKFFMPPKYGTMGNYFDGLASVAFGPGFNNFGFVDKDYNIVVKGPYYMVTDFSGGFSVVTNEVKGKMQSGIINTKGEFVVPMQDGNAYNEAKSYGALYTLLESKFTYYRTDGKTPFTNVLVHSIKFPPAYNNQLNKDLLVYTEGGGGTKRGYLNRDGEVAIPAMFCDAGYFSDNGLAMVKLCEGVTVPKAGAASTAKVDNTTTPAPALNVADGETILAEWRDGWYYPAKLATVGGAKVLQYLDGTEFKMNNAKTRVYDWGVGTRLTCNWLNRGRFYAGKITEVGADGKLHIHYDDGDKEWAEPGQCRCK